MMSYKLEIWAKGEVPENGKNPDIVIQIKMKDKKQRNKWTEQQKLNAKALAIQARNRINDFINDI